MGIYKQTFGGNSMENNHSRHFRPVTKQFTRSTREQQKKVHSIQPELIDSVMPLYQIIRFANQASKHRLKVYTTIEFKRTNGSYTRKTFKGVFRSLVNENRQIVFETSNPNITYILSIEQLLAIQLAEV